jgi:hypothetical protein
MKTAITLIATLGLAVGTGYVVAQTASSPPAGTPPTGTQQQPTMPPTTAPPTGTEQPTSPQANMPTSARPGTPTAPMAPDFATLDRKGAGFVTMQDVTGNEWLTRNFKTCDTDKNGQVSRAEYSACSTRP